MIFIKIIAVLLAAISISKSYLDYKRRREPRVMFIFWAILWLAAAAIVVQPSLIDSVIRYSRDETITVSSVTATAFIFMLYIVYRVYAKAARIEYQQAELIRKLGIKKLHDK